MDYFSSFPSSGLGKSFFNISFAYMKPKEIKAIIFDLDGTLTTSSISWIRICEALGVSFAEQDKLYQKTKKGEITLTAAKRKLIEMYRATGLATQEHFIKMVQSLEYRDYAKEVLSYLQGKGYILSIISGSLDLFVESSAQYFGIKDLYSMTHFKWDHNGEFAGMDYELNQEQKKVEFMDYFLNKHKLSREQCAVVADGDNDIELFKACGYAILIGQEIPEKVKEAVDKHIKSLLELKMIF